MPEQYLQAIIKYLSDKHYQPLKVRQLARRIGVTDENYDAFRDAVKQLRDAGRVVLGEKNSLTLPPMGKTVTGTYRGNPRGFGFVVPQEANAHGDLFIPEGAERDAITGDTVLCRVFKGMKRDGQLLYRGEVVEIIERGHNRFVGELDKATGEITFWFVKPQGSTYTDPIVIDDVGPAAKAGLKVVVEIVRYSLGTDLAHGVIVEMLGQAGPIDIETLGVIRQHGLPDRFPDEVITDARRAIEGFERSGAPMDSRRDFRDWTIVTIDPDDARDYDDAVSIQRRGNVTTLGVHIADVAHFVTEGGVLDIEARQRGNSVYFPRKVVPMLPEVLSNGVCSLQEGQDRLVRTALIDYDADGNVVAERFANGVIRSAKRLTYRQAQGIIDGATGGYDSKVVDLVRQMDALARRIEKRRRQAGMLHLDMPEVELVLDDQGRVIDAVHADQSYTHTIIEMFMVEANEAVARQLDKLKVPFLRRIHPEKDVTATSHLKDFVRACGFTVSGELSRRDMQALIERVRGRPESYAVNLALLKMMMQATYSPQRVGHFALASDAYCHFTSPIRRYPDLTAHRLLDAHLRGQLDAEAAADVSEVTTLGEHCSFTERRAADAEQELRTLLVLQMLESHVGELLEGVVTGITTFGVFIESSKYLVEGLVRLQDLGDDWWEANPKAGVVVAQRTGRQVRMGDAVTARIMAVDLGRRQLNLRIEKFPTRTAAPAGQEKGKKPKELGKGRGKAKAPATPVQTKQPGSQARGKQPGGRPSKRRGGRRRK